MPCCFDDLQYNLHTNPHPWGSSSFCQRFCLNKLSDPCSIAWTDEHLCVCVCVSKTHTGSEQVWQGGAAGRLKKKGGGATGWLKTPAAGAGASVPAHFSVTQKQLIACFQMSFLQNDLYWTFNKIRLINNLKNDILHLYFLQCNFVIYMGCKIYISNKQMKLIRKIAFYNTDREVDWLNYT